MPASGNSVASDTTMALPVAVARCSWKLSMAVTRSSWLVVGSCATCALPAKATMPTFTWRGRSLMKLLAASCAATSRLGCTSAARMLPDTSIARMMVCWFDGSTTTAIGRAAATSIAVMATRNSSGGMWRRRLWPGPIASRTIDRLA
ncbi:hypothetical protein D3C85_351150 [compost metagenome]